MVLELTQFSLKVEGIPEGHVIKILTPDGTYHSFDELVAKQVDAPKAAILFDILQ